MQIKVIFLQKNVTLVLWLYLYNIQINLHPRQMQNCLLLLEGTCQYIELEPAEIQNTEISADFLKRGESKGFC